MTMKKTFFFASCVFGGFFLGQSVVLAEGGTACPSMEESCLRVSQALAADQQSTGNLCFDTAHNEQGRCYIRRVVAATGEGTNTTTCDTSKGEVCRLSGNFTYDGYVETTPSKDCITTGANGSTSGGKCYVPSGSGGGAGNSATNTSVATGLVIPTRSQTGLSDAGLADVITGLASMLLEIFGVIAVIAFIITGFQYMLANGDEAEAKYAKTNLKYSLIAIVVALSGVIVVRAIDAVLNVNQSGLF